MHNHSAPNTYLVIAGSLSFIAALLHLGCIYFGAPWYRFFGAGEQMAIMAEQGNVQATLITLGISSVLFVWAAYAFSAVGLLFRLPFLRTILFLITSVYVLRGIVGFLVLNNPMGRSPEFWVWSSIICLVIGIFHMVGLIKQWKTL